MPTSPNRTSRARSRHRSVHAAAQAGPRSGEHGAYRGRHPFRSASAGPMRRDYELKRFLTLTTKFRDN